MMGLSTTHQGGALTMKFKQSDAGPTSSRDRTGWTFIFITSEFSNFKCEYQ
ncbi:hypothetical protein J2T15_003115 [Paenibacillus harenae]|uniref:Uncharacterized protein n=1 Tax=Paenibacillus harenae TaxID=306543 RepID=A0ABT9U218_PAEHA|nr:hypothetical protein [Paenibacillus harenae]MDQ0113672.1 hypothetical protein [Paenibacillus harenae]